MKNIEAPVHTYKVVLRAEPEIKDHPEPIVTNSEKPSIAVLPFNNMSADPEQEYFADGMTEDIIAALSQLSSLDVIARNSSFAYKGKSVKVQDIGRDLGARYILEGSVRRSGERARITAQLIDAMTGHHVWAERFDRNIDDVFAVQDEITRNIAIALQVQFSTGQHARIWQSGTESFEAWQWQIRGMSAFYRSTRQGFTEAAECFEKAIEIDPEYLAGRTALGYTHSSLARYADDATHSPKQGRGDCGISFGLSTSSVRCTLSARPHSIDPESTRRSGSCVHEGGRGGSK